MYGIHFKDILSAGTSLVLNHCLIDVTISIFHIQSHTQRICTKAKQQTSTSTKTSTMDTPTKQNQEEPCVCLYVCVSMCCVFGRLHFR